MANERELIKERERAHLAQQIEDNPLWSEFFEEFESKLLHAWKTSQSADFREDAWRFSQVADQFRKFITQSIRTGKMAEIALAEMQEKEDDRTNH